jgi:hypothetical protein
VEELGEEVVELVVVRDEHVQPILLHLLEALSRVDAALIQNATSQNTTVRSPQRANKDKRHSYVLMLYEKNSVTISVEPLSVITFSETCAVACSSVSCKNTRQYQCHRANPASLAACRTIPAAFARLKM